MNTKIQLFIQPLKRLEAIPFTPWLSGKRFIVLYFQIDILYWYSLSLSKQIFQKQTRTIISMFHQGDSMGLLVHMSMMMSLNVP